MLVSVLIPAYNSALSIEQTLQSVFEQDYPSIEIIVVNDGSTDNTEEVLAKFSDRIQYYAQKNAGVSAARNLAYSKSKGDFIQYLDADDLLAKGKISAQVNALQNNNADVAYGDWLKFTESNGTYTELERVSKQMQKRPEIELYTNFWVPLAALLYTRRITDKIGGWNLHLPVIQDARYALDAALNKAKFVYTPGIMAQYRAQQSNSLSNKSRINFMSDCFTNAQQIDKLWRGDYKHDLEKKEATVNVLRFCISEFSILDKMKHKQAIDLLLEIEPNYIPNDGRVMKGLSKIFGFRFAEKIAAIKRNLS